MPPDKSDVLYGTLGLLVIKTLEALGPLHGYRIARRIEQISGNQLALNQGTLPGVAQAGADGVDLVQVGHVRERPSCEDLRPHTRRAEATAASGSGLAARREHRRTLSQDL